MRRDIRLRRSADFDRVRASRSTVAHPLLVLARRRREDAGPARVGIIVGRRLGHAAARNRVKRRLREAARALYSSMASGWDVVLIARPAARDATQADLVAALRSLIHRAQDHRPVESGGSP